MKKKTFKERFKESVNNLIENVIKEDKRTMLGIVFIICLALFIYFVRR